TPVVIAAGGLDEAAAAIAEAVAIAHVAEIRTPFVARLRRCRPPQLAHILQAAALVANLREERRHAGRCRANVEGFHRLVEYARPVLSAHDGRTGGHGNLVVAYHRQRPSRKKRT